LATVDSPIGVVDSGIGGVPYLLKMREQLPNERFVYYADQANFPYGTRAQTEVVRLVDEVVARMVRRYAPKFVVVACNTASVVALESLRKRFDLPFVGVVPAIKPAAAIDRGPIGVLATDRALQDVYVDALIADFAPDHHVVRVAAGETIDLVENRLMTATQEEIEATLQEPMRHLRESEARTVVLGCTHFLHVRHTIAAMLGHGCELVDSLSGVTRQAIRICNQVGCADAHGATVDSGEGVVVVRGTPTRNYELLAEKHRLVLEHDDGNGPDRQE
jgi:glutamate racemase